MSFRGFLIKGLLAFFLLSTLSCKNEAANNKTEPIHETTTPKHVVMGTSDLIEKILIEKDSTLFFEKDSLQSFYKLRENKPAWENSSVRNSFLDTLKNSELQGFFFKDYHEEEITTLSENLENLSSEELSNLDILLTDSFLKFGKQLWLGKTNPKKIHEIWDLKRKGVSITQLLQQAIIENDLEVVLKELRPKNPIYHQLINAAKEERKRIAANVSTFEKIPSGKMIKPDHSDLRIPAINNRLYQLGYLKVRDTSKINSETTQQAIKDLQQEHGLMIDGIIGDATIATLNMTPNDWYDVIQANLERWRWYPRDLGENYILINVANFKLELILNGKLKEEHKVVVGSPARETPVFEDEIENIVLNPSWYIPPTIKSKDVIPGARKNSNYISKKHLIVFSRNGEKLDPSTINWNSKEVYTYQFKQDPGSANPLGQVKINFPNKHLIYLHDTNSKALFENNSRSHSSGCVRVEGAVKLAKLLVSDQKAYNSDKIDELLESGKTRYINLSKPLKIYIFYWTAWQENGKTHFTQDIYNNDQAILKALKATP